jgi:hypothetical protein
VLRLLGGWFVTLLCAALALVLAVFLVMWARGSSGPPPKRVTAIRGAKEIRQAAEVYMGLEELTRCPTLDQLVGAQQLDRGKVEDPYGTRYRIMCGRGEVRVWSSGPDRLPYTDDDLGDETDEREAR